MTGWMKSETGGDVQWILRKGPYVARAWETDHGTVRVQVTRERQLTWCVRGSTCLWEMEDESISLDAIKVWAWSALVNMWAEEANEGIPA